MLRAMQNKAAEALHRVSTVLNVKHPAARIQQPVVPVPAEVPQDTTTPAPETREPVFPEIPQDRAVPMEAVRGIQDLPFRRTILKPQQVPSSMPEFQPVQVSARTAAAAEPSGSRAPIQVHYGNLVEAIVARARALPRNGTVRLRFALQPADLGIVKVRIDTRGQAVRVEIAATSSQAVDTLNQGVSRLSQQLQDAGYRDPDVQLTLDTAGDSGASAKHSQHAQQRAGMRRYGTGHGPQHETPASPKRYPLFASPGRLDLVA
jgi:hypothetical protein